MSVKMDPAKAKLKWNKSSLLETDLYIKIYLSALNKHFDPADKHSLFLVSKFYTDGAAEVGRNNLTIAAYYFSRGEAYHRMLTKESEIQKRILDNVYHRSKSFYYYKQKDFKTSITLISQTLENNQYLEKKGFEFLLFDRVQQYFNLARVYFAKDEPDQAFKILADSTAFLIKLRAGLLTDLNDHALKDYTQDISRLRFALLFQFVFDTAEQLFRISDRKEFFITSSKYFIHVTKAAASFKVIQPDDVQMKEWLMLIKLFYDKKTAIFEKEAALFFEKNYPYFSGRARRITELFLKMAG